MDERRNIVLIELTHDDFHLWAGRRRPNVPETDALQGLRAEEAEEAREGGSLGSQTMLAISVVILRT